MKYARFALTALLAVSFTAAAAPTEESQVAKWEKAKASYIRLLQHPNPGVKASAADFIRKYNIVEATDALKEVLKCENCEPVKMYAALALVRISGSEGVSFIEEVIKHEQNELVRTFYRSLLHIDQEERAVPLTVN